MATTFVRFSAWPTNGKKSSSMGLATATLRSSLGSSRKTEESPHPDWKCDLAARQRYAVGHLGFRLPDWQT